MAPAGLRRQSLNALVQAAFQTCSFLLRKNVFISNTVNDRLHYLELFHRFAMVAGVNRFDHTLDVGADHAALAGFQDATSLGLAGALACLLAVRHRYLLGE